MISIVLLLVGVYVFFRLIGMAGSRLENNDRKRRQKWRFGRPPQR
jgi:hypothetical protein